MLSGPLETEAAGGVGTIVAIDDESVTLEVLQIGTHQLAAPHV
jgi:hypothetical protein